MPPFDARTEAQIGAFTGASAILGLVATKNKPTGTRAAVTAGAAALGAALSFAGAGYIAKRRCQAVCEALNALARGEQVLIDWWLATALAQYLADRFKRGAGACPKPPYKTVSEEWEALQCIALEKLIPILKEAQDSEALSGETWTKG